MQLRTENSRMVRAAGVVGAATLLSRILGYIRDAAIAWFFGAGLSTDAFIAAFRIPNLFRRLFGEGSLSNVFVPVFTDYLTREGQFEASKLASSALWLLSAILVAISILGVLLSPLLVHIIAAGFADTPNKLLLTVTLTRIMFLYIFFIGLVALCMGILNALGHFAAPALAPVLLNLATTTAVLPGLSRQAALNDVDALKATFTYAMKLILFITLPAMVGLIVLREPVVALLFQRGEFGADATVLTAYALLYYAIGLWAFSAVRIVVATFFAMQDTQTPAQTAIISIIANIVFGIMLMRPLDHGGLALATTLASILNLGLLIRALRLKLGQPGWRNIAFSTCRTMACSGVMGVVVWKVAVALIPSGAPSASTLLPGLMVSIASGLLTYGVVCYLIRSPEYFNVVAEAKNSIRKR